MSELTLQRSSAQLHLGAHPGATGLVGELKRGPLGARTGHDHEQVDDIWCHRQLAGGQQHPLHPGRPPRCRRRSAAQLLDQAVVAAAAADTRLGAEGVGRELEHGPRVVVQAPDQRRVELVCQPGVVEQLSHPGEVLGVLRLETIEQDRGALHRLLGAPVTGVERPHRVEVDPGDHLRRQLVGVRPQVRGQLFAVLSPCLRRAEAGEPQPGLPDPEGLQQLGEQQNQLGVGLRRGRPDHLSADLPELPVAPALRGLGPEVARQVPELHRLRELVHPVLQVGPADRRGDLRPQRQRPAAPVVEGVHLLLDDVGRLADGADEQLGGLERRRLDPSVAGRAEDAPGVRFQQAAALRIFREHIERAAGGLDRAHGRAWGLLLVREVAQKRIRVALRAERGQPHVAGVDGHLGRIGVDQRLDRGEQRGPVATGEVDPADGPLE